MNNQKYEDHVVFVAAGFWKRLLSRMIDNSFFVIFIITFFISSINNNHYRSEWLRVIGVLFTIIIISCASIVPLFFGSGQTLGKKLLGMKIIDIEERDDKKYLIKREIMFSFLLMLNFVMFFSFVNSHLLFEMNQPKNNLSSVEIILLNSILSSMSFWWIFIIGCGLVMVFRKDKKHIADLYSGTMVISIAQTHEVRVEIESSLKPIPAKVKKKLEFVD